MQRVVLRPLTRALCSIALKMEEHTILLESQVSWFPGNTIYLFADFYLVNYVLPNDSV